MTEDGVEVGDLYSCILVLTVFDFVLYLFALAVVEDLDDQLGKGHSRDKLADFGGGYAEGLEGGCLLYTSPSPRDLSTSRMPSSA